MTPDHTLIRMGVCEAEIKGQTKPEQRLDMPNVDLLVGVGKGRDRCAGGFVANHCTLAGSVQYVSFE